MIDGLRALGWWGFPIRITADPSRPDHFDKVPIVKWKPYQDRPPTDRELAAWSKRFRNYNAGIPTGPAPGYFIVDADTPEAVERLELRGMTETVIVRTRRGIWYFYSWPDELDVPNNESKIAEGVDIRGRGGYAVAPGSSYITANGTRFTYRFDAGHSPSDLAIAPAPQWLLDWFREQQRAASTAPPPRPYRGRLGAWAKKAFEGEIDLLRCAIEGTRNAASRDAAFRLGQLAAGGELEESEVLAALNAIADAWPNASHTRDTIRRSFAVGRELPRSAPPRRLAWTSIPVSPALGEQASQGLAQAPLGDAALTIRHDAPLGQPGKEGGR